MTLLLGFVLGVLAAGVPLWLQPYDRAGEPEGLFVAGLVVLAILTGWLVGERIASARRAAAVMALCLPAADAARIIVDTARDPTSHNLWPLELVFLLVMGLIPVAGGVLGGLLLRRFGRGG